jgi:hypothetical protein
VNGQVINLPTANIPCVHDASAKVRPAGVVEQLVNARRRLGSEFALPVEIVQQLFLRFAVLPPDGICLFQPACQACFALADGIIGGEKFAAREGQDDEGELTPAEGEHVIGEEGGEQKLRFHAPLQPNAFPRRFRLRFNLRVGLQLRSPSVYHQRLQGSDEPKAAGHDSSALSDPIKIRALSQRCRWREGCFGDVKDFLGLLPRSVAGRQLARKSQHRDGLFLAPCPLSLAPQNDAGGDIEKGRHFSQSMSKLAVATKR